MARFGAPWITPETSTVAVNIPSVVEKLSQIFVKAGGEGRIEGHSPPSGGRLRQRDSG
jgi:hypothetical protein